MRKVVAAVAGFLVSLCAPSAAHAQKAALVPTLSTPSMLVFGAALSVAAIFVQRRRK